MFLDWQWRTRQRSSRIHVPHSVLNEPFTSSLLPSAPMTPYGRWDFSLTSISKEETLLVILDSSTSTEDYTKREVLMSSAVFILLLWHVFSVRLGVCFTLWISVIRTLTLSNQRKDQWPTWIAPLSEIDDSRRTFPHSTAFPSNPYRVHRCWWNVRSHTWIRYWRLLCPIRSFHALDSKGNVYVWGKHRC